ncbi:unnamed protein product [Dicrocoelium dendriticum]|nr:unnamed protein product [Dicrocoelium dendriticum]
MFPFGKNCFTGFIPEFMSVLSLQVGQCGNQLGAEFFQTVYSDCFDTVSNPSRLDREYISDSVSSFFHESNDATLEAKCIQVDTEEKVIARLHRTSRQRGWRYPDDCSQTAKCGSGTTRTRLTPFHCILSKPRVASSYS